MDVFDVIAIQNPISAVTLTMTEAYNIYQQYRQVK